ncbi:hypothetical protein DH2020_048186 [Rehmannia glutinosa]|uniref:Retrotransposon Copia-like N-terminal domain-containing protein n=1 Tax=Rehmannia glutinosa TaxID=99300 RepID=A0ABR0U6C4_REHGL
MCAHALIGSFAIQREYFVVLRNMIEHILFVIIAPQTTTNSAPDQTIQLQAQLVTVKLNENNHLVWKQQVLAAIRGYGLEPFIDGTKKTPEPYLTGSSQEQRTPNPAYSSWMRQDQLLVSWLLSTLSEGVLITTVGKNTSKEIWDCLEAGFASQNQAKVMQYKLQLQTVKKGNSSMREYLGKIKSLCDLLTSSGSQVSEAEHISHILLGLGSEYDAVMISITTRAVPCTLMEAYSILLSFENRIENSENIGNDNSPFSKELEIEEEGMEEMEISEAGEEDLASIITDPDVRYAIIIIIQQTNVSTDVT